MLKVDRLRIHLDNIRITQLRQISYHISHLMLQYYYYIITLSTKLVDTVQR